MRCKAITGKGTRCKNDAVNGSDYCHIPSHREKEESVEENITKLSLQELRDRMNEQQKVFIDEYLIDLNATQSAVRAGYSEDTARQQGSRLLTNVYIDEYRRRMMKEREERTKISQDRVLQEYAKVGFADIKNFLSFRTEQTVIDRDETGQPIIDYQTIVELKDSDNVDGTVISEVQLKDGTLKFKLHDKMKALNDISRHLGMFNDKLELGVKELPTINLVRGDSDD